MSAAMDYAKARVEIAKFRLEVRRTIRDLTWPELRIHGSEMLTIVGVALIAYPLKTEAEIARIADIPRSTARRTLGKLMAMGWVERRGNRYVDIRANSPQRDVLTRKVAGLIHSTSRRLSKLDHNR